MKRKIVSKSYAIEINEDDFDAINKFEFEAARIEECLYHILEARTYARNVDYNGHFGNFIYLSLETDDDTKEQWDMIEHIITEHIRHSIQFIVDNDL